MKGNATTLKDLADIQDIDDIPTQARDVSDPNVTSFGSFVIRCYEPGNNPFML